MVDDAGADGDIDASSDAGAGVGDDGDTLRPSSKGLESIWTGVASSSGGGGAGALLLLCVPISIPTASERVTGGFEIGCGFGSVEEVAFGVESISIPAASERVTAGIEIGCGLGLLLYLIRVMMLWIRGINTVWSLVLF